MENPEGKEIINKDDFEIKSSDLRSENQQEWLSSDEEVPDILWEKIKDIPPDIPFKNFVMRIRKSLFDLYGPKRDKAKSFSDSRFTPLAEMVERGMISCGALANIFATVLRKFGIPVRLVHGILKSQDGNKSSRHAWLEIFNPISGLWFEADPTRNDFRVSTDATRIKIYKNWSELKSDYKNGEY